jgi:hypothetical protein
VGCGRYDWVMPRATSSEPRSPTHVAVSPPLAKAIAELQRVQKVLLRGEDLDPHILADFREALNRVRNAAWSAQQYLASKATDQDSTGVLAILAGERVRAAYQLCQTIQEDLKSPEVKFQKRQLIQLHLVAKALTEQLGEVVGKLESGRPHSRAASRTTGTPTV